MGRIIAVDYGPKRVGLAATDPLRIIASPLTTLGPGKAVEFIADYVSHEQVDIIVVGMPQKLDGSPSENAAGAEKFAERLRERFPAISVDYEDERFTSVIAHRAMIEAGVKKSDRRDKALVDRTSASLILQSYLERISK